MAIPTDMSIPWSDDQYYVINGVKYAYETHAGLDFIWLYDGMGKIFIGDIRSQCHHVIEPKRKRVGFTQCNQTKAPSAGSISYYGRKAA